MSAHSVPASCHVCGALALFECTLCGLPICERGCSECDGKEQAKQHARDIDAATERDRLRSVGCDRREDE